VDQAVFAWLGVVLAVECAWWFGVNNVQFFHGIFYWKIVLAVMILN
jgi:hypothetical protein